jgi:hypothetical protein
MELLHRPEPAGAGSREARLSPEGRVVDRHDLRRLAHPRRHRARDAHQLRGQLDRQLDGVDGDRGRQREHDVTGLPATPARLQLEPSAGRARQPSHRVLEQQAAGRQPGRQRVGERGGAPGVAVSRYVDEVAGVALHAVEVLHDRVAGQVLGVRRHAEAARQRQDPLLAVPAPRGAQVEPVGRAEQPATGARPGLQHHHVVPGADQLVGDRETADAGTHDHDVHPRLRLHLAHALESGPTPGVGPHPGRGPSRQPCACPGWGMSPVRSPA